MTISAKNKRYFISSLAIRIIQYFVVYKYNLKEMLMFPEGQHALTLKFCFSRCLFPVILLLNILMISCKNSPDEEDEERLEMDGMQKAMRQEFFMTRDPALNIVPKERLL